MTTRTRALVTVCRSCSSGALPSSMFHCTVSLSWRDAATSSAPYRSYIAFARNTWNTRAASDRSGQASSRSHRATRARCVLRYTRGPRVRPASPEGRRKPIRTPRRSRRGRHRRNRRPGVSSAVGTRASSCQIAENNNATSSTLRAIGPSTAMSNHGFCVGHAGTRPGVGRKPTTLQNAADCAASRRGRCRRRSAASSRPAQRRHRRCCRRTCATCRTDCAWRRISC